MTFPIMIASSKNS